MCGIAGVLRVIRTDSAEYPPEGSLRRASGEWLWQGEAVEPREVPRATAGGRAWLIPDEALDALDEKIAWRGPDGAGRFRDRVIKKDGTIVEVALVHRRLSIIDHAGGAQPMVVSGCAACDGKASGHRAIEPSSKDSERSRGSARDEDATAHGSLCAVVFNGCIYDHRTLRERLEADGCRFETDHSDTEVIAHVWREWSLAGLQDAGEMHEAIMTGMFALALWDRSGATLVSSRDGFGEKPFYFRRDEARGLVAFASTAGAVQAVSGLFEDGAGDAKGSAAREASDRRDLAAGIAEYLYLGFNHRFMPLRGVEQDRGSTDWGRLLQRRTSKASDNAKGILFAMLGVIMLIGFSIVLARLGNWVLSIIPGSAAGFMVLKLFAAWWVKHALKAASPAHRHRRVEGLEEALRDSVVARLDADVPLGCFLSGGIDSSLIASLAREALGSSLETFSMRMPDDAYDESEHAERVARHLGARHTTFDCDARTAADDLVHLIELYGLPFGDSSILPAYWLCRGTREHVKVALSGEGGDELFHGYERHRAQRYMYFWIKPFVAQLPTRSLDLRDPKSVSSKRYRLIHAARQGGYRDILALFPTADLEQLIGARLARTARPPLHGQSPAEFDRRVYLPDDLLRKTDLASMAVGLEVRCPFLDVAVARSASRFSIGAHTRGGVTKAVLRNLARTRGLPDEIVSRKKQGFAIPISDWFRTDFGGLRTLLLDHLEGERPFGHVHDLVPMNMEFVRRLLDEHWAAGGLTPMHTTRSVRPRDHGQRLFALLALAIWARGRS